MHCGLEMKWGSILFTRMVYLGSITTAIFPASTGIRILLAMSAYDSYVRAHYCIAAPGLVAWYSTTYCSSRVVQVRGYHSGIVVFFLQASLHCQIRLA